MCTCRNDIEKKLLARVIEQKPEAKDHAASLKGYVFGFKGNTLVMSPVMPLEVTYEQELKKKPGEYRTKKEKMNMFFSFCPFCGVNLKEEIKSEGNES